MTTVHRTTGTTRSVQKRLARTLLAAGAGVVVVGIGMPTADAARTYIPFPPHQNTIPFNTDPAPASPAGCPRAAGKPARCPAPDMNPNEPGGGEPMPIGPGEGGSPNGQGQGEGSGGGGAGNGVGGDTGPVPGGTKQSRQ